jgi:hypothetical protein
MNFFTDNTDLKFIFESADLGDIIMLYENSFREGELYDYAPGSVEEAIKNYRLALETAGDISAGIIAPLGERIDTEPNVLSNGRVIYSKPLQICIQALTHAELMACTISRKYGGLNLPNFIFTMLSEIISQADASVQNIFGLQGIGSIIETFADENLKNKYLPLFASNKVTGAMALTEDGAGSDLQSVRLKAVEYTDGTWRLNGVKRFITNGNAEILLVLARSEPGTTDGLGLSLFICDGDKTITVRRLEDKLGIHGSPTCELYFKDTPACLIGERQRGLVTYVLALLNGARLATAAQSIGIAQAAFNEALNYAQVRKQYGRKIETFPAVAEMITKMKVSIEASRALTYEAAKIMDIYTGTGKRINSEDLDTEEKRQLRKKSKKFERLAMLFSSLAKYYCSEMSIQVTGNAIQVLGGSGYMRDYPVEKYYRDARITNIYEGTSQIQVSSAVRGILNNTLEKYFEEINNFEFSGQQAVLEKKLLRGRKLLLQTIDFISSQKDDQLMEFHSRRIVDMAAGILIGYLFLQQSLKSPRKLVIAQIYIKELETLLKMKANYIKNIKTTSLINYDLIVERGCSRKH